MNNKDIIRDMVDDIYAMRGAFINEQTDQMGSDNNSQVVTFTRDDEVLQQYMTEVHEQVKNVSIEFNDMNYIKNQEKVQWSGTISGGINWTVMYSNKDHGMYIGAENQKVTKEDTFALNKLNLYFEQKWYSQIREAMLKNELDK